MGKIKLGQYLFKLDLKAFLVVTSMTLYYIWEVIPVLVTTLGLATGTCR